VRVYLSGTITADPATHKWREDIAFTLAEMGHTSYSPMRGKDPDSLDRLGLASNIPASLFVRRDLADLEASTVMILYFPKGVCNDRQSIGTWAEFGVAMHLHIPIIVVSDEPTVLNHPFIKIGAAVCISTLEEAVDVVNWLDN
jgi:hypothetical protein